jgi:hypothetical protein
VQVLGGHRQIRDPGLSSSRMWRAVMRRPCSTITLRPTLMSKGSDITAQALGDQLHVVLALSIHPEGVEVEEHGEDFSES